LAVAHLSLSVDSLLIYYCTEGKLVTQWARNLSHWVTSFRHGVTFMSLSCSVKRCCGCVLWQLIVPCSVALFDWYSSHKDLHTYTWGRTWIVQTRSGGDDFIVWDVTRRASTPRPAWPSVRYN